MSRISAAFKKPGYVALIPYITAGYPTIEATSRIAELLASAGSDIIEIGIPFSDPLADGVTIQRASFKALQNGVTPELCFDIAKQVSRSTTTPLIFMTYFNPVLNYGLEKFCRSCALSGVDGLIVPDLPPEEGPELEKAAKDQGIDLIYLLPPTCTDRRIKLVAQHSRGFIYLVSVTGVTGARDRLPADLENFVTRVRKIAKLPLCVGFGISTAEQARLVARIADGIIVGSKIIQLIEAEDELNSLTTFITELRNSLDDVARSKDTSTNDRLD